MTFLEPNIQEAEILYKTWLQRQKKFCSCVLYAKATTGFDEPVGYAKNWPINSDIPKVGEIVVLNESRFGHVAVITQVKESSFVIMEENYTPCKVGTREIQNNYSNILGFYESP